jgi:hypothetical protein
VFDVGGLGGDYEALSGTVGTRTGLLSGRVRSANHAASDRDQGLAARCPGGYDCAVGLFRKSLIIGTGGLAPIKGDSAKERTARAAEKQVRLQEQALSGSQGTATAKSRTARSRAFRIACAYCGQKVWMPKGHNVACPTCHEVMDVCQVGGVPGIRPVRAVRRDAAATDGRGRVISSD